MPSKSSSFTVSAERPHDYVYDPLFTVPTTKDVQKAARAAEQRVSQIRLVPNFKFMFSELPHFPRATVVRHSMGRMPSYQFLSTNSYPVRIPNRIMSKEVTGVDRHKYFTSALEPVDDGPESPPPLIRLAAEPWQPKILQEPAQTTLQPVSPLRGSLLEPVPETSVVVRYKHTGTQTVPLPPSPARTVVAVGGSEADERLVVRGRAGQLQLANVCRLQQAGRLRNEHAALASKVRAERRDKLCSNWERERNVAITRLLATHNRELRKLSREFGSRRSVVDKTSVAPLLRLGGPRSCSEKLALPTLPALPVTATTRTTTARESRGRGDTPHPSPWSPSDISRRESLQYH